MSNKGPRRKHIPQRTCIGCREILPKRSLIRIVRSQDGVRVDLTGKMSGRGAYLHDRRLCWLRGMKGALAHALKVELTAEDIDRLNEFIATLRGDDTEMTEYPSQEEQANG